MFQSVRERPYNEQEFSQIIYAFVNAGVDSYGFLFMFQEMLV